MTIGRNIGTIAFGAAMALCVAGLAGAQQPTAPERPRAEGTAPGRAARPDSMRERAMPDRRMNDRMMNDRRMNDRMMRGQAMRGGPAMRGQGMGPGPYARRAQVQRGRVMVERGRMMMERGRMDRMDRMGAAGRAGLMGDAALMRGVQLDDQQRTRLNALRESYRTQSAELMRAGRPDSAMRAEMVKRQRDAMEKGVQLRERHAADIRALLTPEQQKQFDANRERMTERLDRMRERAPQEGRGRIAPPPGAPDGPNVRRGPGGSL